MARFESAKKELYEELKTKYINPSEDYEKKLKRYNKIWERGEEIAKYFYFNTSTNKSMPEIVSGLVNEFYSFKGRGSILSSYRDLSSRSFEENIQRAIKLRVKGRLKEFLNDFGSELYTFNGKTKTLNQWVNQYIKGNLDANVLFNIIELWKAGNTPYMEEFYRKSESADDIIEQQRFSGNLY